MSKEISELRGHEGREGVERGGGHSPLAEQIREVSFRAKTKPLFLGYPDLPELELERPRCQLTIAPEVTILPNRPRKCWSPG